MKEMWSALQAFLLTNPPKRCINISERMEAWYITFPLWEMECRQWVWHRSRSPWDPLELETVRAVRVEIHSAGRLLCLSVYLLHWHLHYVPILAPAWLPFYFMCCFFMMWIRSGTTRMKQSAINMPTLCKEPILILRYAGLWAERGAWSCLDEIYSWYVAAWCVLQILVTNVMSVLSCLLPIGVFSFLAKKCCVTVRDR